MKPKSQVKIQDEEEGGDNVEKTDDDNEEETTEAQKSAPRQGETPMSENQQAHGK